MSNKTTNMIVGLLKEAFPTSIIPTSYYDATKSLTDSGLNYVLLHACKYDQAFFWREFKDTQHCPVCATSRWKYDYKKNSWKVLQYFPIKPRFQRLFMLKKMAEDMSWH